ncbi:IS66 family insertion sequence element accessory protein TnpA [Xenorhabdus griffiniae]|uniref:Helix-turn-helix domain-containing protein n=1 Tax=Xenorhabdus griffiniae TaxID=351672 RepID=A0ABY9XD83_9GAMM|nr:transposase [Xenorhabdus griffiniae]MBD1229687.1 helix-turn-helix domain-containing protein [Xenorhabdus griffiniae]MBE8589072.1 helix-turn-helix domain-containing protein [Xenorhabdus griffiniae]WMV70860.1 helix-turn-helix domain-containing protein [Xenorhabdus griffiniae]WMV71116.1 helix-turn-helix domain-containing protein [Xenorhabdus griffiniae]WMV73435.1 helix-turn-helix domain-containing protein [Xenorhabdus griffiniae]
MTLTEKQQHWITVIAAQKQSGMTVTAYCQHHEINLATFYYWAKKLRQQQAPQRLHPVVVDEHAEAEQTVTLFLPGGLRAELPVELSTAQIRHWIEALQ